MSSTRLLAAARPALGKMLCYMVGGDIALLSAAGNCSSSAQEIIQWAAGQRRGGEADRASRDLSHMLAASERS